MSWSQPYVFPTRAILVQRTHLFPLPPVEGPAEVVYTSPETNVLDYCKQNNIASRVVSCSGLNAGLGTPVNPLSRGTEYREGLSLPLSDVLTMKYLFATCDVCKDYLAPSHSVETLPSGARFYVRNEYEFICPGVEMWQPGHIEGITNHEDFPSSRWSIPYFNLVQDTWLCYVFPTSTQRMFSRMEPFVLCRQCQNELLRPVSRRDAHGYIERFQQVVRSMKQVNGGTMHIGNPKTIDPIFHDHTKPFLFVSLCKDEVNQTITDRLLDKQRAFCVPRFIKKATPSTMLGTDQPEEDVSMDPTDDSQTSQSEDTQNPWQEELDQLAEFEYELAGYSL